MPYCPSPPFLSPTTPQGTPSATTETPAEPGAPASPDVQFGGGGEGARSGETAAISAPNLIGDLLFTSRSISFGFVRVNGLTNFQGLASTSIVNSSVAENNSPIPADRVYFRYNFFDNSQSVTGLSPFSIVQQNIPGSPSPPVLLQLPETKQYDSNLYTFGVEKTFFNGLMSIELRAPVVTSLASHNTISVGDVTGLRGINTESSLQNFGVATTPQNTLGHEDTEWGDLTIILKGLLCQNRSAGFAVSGGMAVTAPTGQDTHLGVIDYAGNPSRPTAVLQRQQTIVIANETASLSPFVAGLYAPNERLFTQGFLSVEVPVGSSRITYNDQHFGFPAGTGAFLPIGPPNATNVSSIDYINEQTLLHLDWNIGYWIYRAPESRCLTGIAPCFEVHYTSTLDNADVVQLPSDGSFVIPAVPLNQLPLRTNVPFVPAPGPVVGGQHNRLDIVDLTFGTTFLLGSRTTLATAFTIPVTNGANRTFDWEYQLQLNYYFGHR
jgi:hypothetical protein